MTTETADQLEHDRPPRLPWAVLVACVAGAFALAILWADMRERLATQGEQIMSLRRDSDRAESAAREFRGEIREALGLGRHPANP
jgi:hypothetical protein